MLNDPPLPFLGRVREGWLAFTNEQRFGVTLFGACGVLALVFSAWYIRAHIRAPFLASKERLWQAQAFVSETERKNREQEASRLKDSDGDGLNDADELKLYKTSPYVADSDSDGVDDATEIATGQDPNCPRGRLCQPQLDASALQGSAASSSGRDLLEVTPAGRLQRSQGADLNAAQIREFLVRNGLANEADLRGLSDQALIDLYRRASSSAQTPTQGANTLPLRP